MSGRLVTNSAITFTEYSVYVYVFGIYMLCVIYSGNWSGIQCKWKRGIREAGGGWQLTSFSLQSPRGKCTYIIEGGKASRCTGTTDQIPQNDKVSLLTLKVLVATIDA